MNVNLQSLILYFLPPWTVLWLEGAKLSWISCKKECMVCSICRMLFAEGQKSPLLLWKLSRTSMHSCYLSHISYESYPHHRSKWYWSATSGSGGNIWGLICDWCSNGTSSGEEKQTSFLFITFQVFMPRQKRSPGSLSETSTNSTFPLLSTSKRWITASSSIGLREHVEYTRQPPTASISRPLRAILTYRKKIIKRSGTFWFSLALIDSWWFMKHKMHYWINEQTEKGVWGLC